MSTAATYVAAAYAANPTADLKTLLRFYEKTSRTESRTRSTPMRAWHLKRLLRRGWGDSAVVAVTLAFVFGQRISDVLQIRVENVSRVRLRAGKFTVIKLVRGKTIRHTGPYTLHLPYRTHLAHSVRKLCRAGGDQLFVPNGSGGSKSVGHQRMLKDIRLKLLAIDERLDLRSIRRGGLQHMAQGGMPHAEIREHFSKHTTARRLMEYLEWGTFSKTQAALHKHRCARVSGLLKQ